MNLTVLINTHKYPVDKRSFSANKQSFSANKQSFSANKQSFSANKKIIKKAVLDTLLENRVEGDVEISVSVVSKKMMLDLSKKYLDDGSLHEVLSFSQEDGPGPDKIVRLGDVVLCWPEVLKCTVRDKVAVDQEVYMLTAHAVLHLLGKHHEEL